MFLKDISTIATLLPIMVKLNVIFFFGEERP